MEQAIVYIGIDVAKAYLDVSWAGEARRFSNEGSGHAALVRWLKTSQRPVQLICEASGGYEKALLESLAEGDLAVTLVQAVRVRQYARAAGIRLGPVEWITEHSGFGGAVPMRAQGASAARAAPVPIATGDDTLEVTVTVGFTIAQ